MIWIKRHNFVFIQIPKNASESVFAYLKDNAESEDVFTNVNGFDQNILDPHRLLPHMDASYVLKNDLAPITSLYIGIIRNPFERLLSLYLYRHRQKRYSSKLSVQDFREKANLGFIQDHPWQMQLQSSFLAGASNKELWCFDNLDKHIKIFSEKYYLTTSTLPIINKSTSHLTKDLISTFYDKYTERVVKEYWHDDFDLYNELING
jgi:hypothetical protein